jgi:L-lactate dehydrogenase complex protein LldF
MSRAPEHIDFRHNTRHVEPHMPASVQRATASLLGKRNALVEGYGPDRWEALRQAGHDLRLHTLAHLDHYLTLLEERVKEAGGHVHWARDAEEARRIVLEIARQHGVHRSVKVKSMATEEIDLNGALERAGIEVRETDLGEYIVQLAGEMPSHIIAPAVHLTKEGIADLFHRKLGVDAPPEPTRLTEIARARLREEFLAAEMGISGGNFLVAETGTLVLVTNEGNGRMCTTLPPLHVAVVGIDKVLPDRQCLSVVLELLPRNATGQKLTCYTTLLAGPAASAGEHGPGEFHLVLLDNGRSRILADELTRQTLLCIRCGACLNVCPVYNNVGGHAYGWVYSGPIGAILSPQLLGAAVAADLPFASSLCGACADICPVKIPIPEILLHLRRRVVEGDETGPGVLAPALKAGGAAASTVMAMPHVYEAGTQLVRAAQAPLRRDGWLPALPPPADRWTDVRPFIAFDADFRSWWRRRTPEGRARDRRRRIAVSIGVSLAAAGIAVLLGRHLGRRQGP